MISTALTKTLKSFFDPVVLLILFLPFVIASLFWFIMLFVFWGVWTGYIVDTAPFIWMTEHIGAGLFVESVKVIAIILATAFVFGPLWYLTYILIISVFLFPMLLPRVQKRDYPNLEKKKGGSTIGSIKNTLVATAVFIFGFLVTLPLWLFTPLAPAIQLLLTAYLNKKIFTYDVLQDYASESEREIFQTKYKHELWGLGFITAFLIWVPFANLIAPAVTSVSFVHYGLGQLENIRKNNT